MAKALWKGNEAIAEAAVRAGCQAYFGYPITPQTELLEYMAWRMPELGRVFLQAESEIGAINMVFGAASAGFRAMTSTSGPGFSLMQEGLSYIAGSRVPCVIVDIMRGGPGLGNICPSQADYFQVTRSAGHGDYRPVVLAPASVQEAIDLTVLAFDLAQRYRHIVVLAADGIIGQMMEPAEMPEMRTISSSVPDWALSGAAGRPPRLISSLGLLAEDLEAMNEETQRTLREIERTEVRWEQDILPEMDLLVVAFGTTARIARTAIRRARQDGLRVGLFRPITLWPFPRSRLRALAGMARKVLVVEMNAGQMVDDVDLALGGLVPVRSWGRLGGVVPTPDDLYEVLMDAGRLPRVPPHVAEVHHVPA
ncbi:MAG: 3-methyl-2-oxobutanoate dehydrogenase subunit VorB [Anaerolineae bacterium]